MKLHFKLKWGFLMNKLYKPNKLIMGLVGIALQLFPTCDYPPKKPITTTITYAQKNKDYAENPSKIIVEMGEPEFIEEYYEEDLEMTLEELYSDYLKETGISKKVVQKTIVINKSKRELSVYVNHLGLNSTLEPYGTLLKTYHQIALGTRPIGDKVREGDRRTPEGEFYVARKVPNSDYHKALLISYPNIEDAKRGLTEGLINKIQSKKIIDSINKCKTPPQNTKLGSYLEIHGSGKGRDWTWGCIGLDNSEIDELYNFSNSGCKKYNGARIPRTNIIINP
jgi:murein L,D-transpeptidase YafK